MLQAATVLSVLTTSSPRTRDLQPSPLSQGPLPQANAPGPPPKSLLGSLALASSAGRPAARPGASSWGRGTAKPEGGALCGEVGEPGRGLGAPSPSKFWTVNVFLTPFSFIFRSSSKPRSGAEDKLQCCIQAPRCAECFGVL